LRRMRRRLFTSLCSEVLQDLKDSSRAMLDSSNVNGWPGGSWGIERPAGSWPKTFSSEASRIIVPFPGWGARRRRARAIGQAASGAKVRSIPSLVENVVGAGGYDRPRPGRRRPHPTGTHLFIGHAEEPWQPNRPRGSYAKLLTTRSRIFDRSGWVGLQKPRRCWLIRVGPPRA